ncbi:MAG: DNA recombination protein RmuC [Limnobacter sp.]|nr:DNA recombination protein RmuC [Limnobacter sp.]
MTPLSPIFLAFAVVVAFAALVGAVFGFLAWRRLSLQSVVDALELQKEAAQSNKFQLEELHRQLRTMGQEMESRHDQLTDKLNTALNTAFSQARQEATQAQGSLQQLLMTHFAQGNQAQREKLEQFSDTLHRTNTVLREQLTEIRQSVEQKLKELQADNTAKLEEMRKTVDEKLHATLEQRLGHSFKQVSDRLEQVYKGLGEMQSLAAGVGDLKRVLTNVKTRGTWGEIQLQALLDQLLTPSQYAQNVKTVPGSSNLVEFAIRLPGKGPDDEPVWLPIDSKFPKEQYERLLDAFDRADAPGVAQAGKALEAAVKLEAKSMAEKYLSPPHTTDFGILFLPTEGLYAEVVKRAGLVDDLQRLHRVTVAGPVTLATLLNALQMGFKTLALEKRSSEVWQVLSAVKTEFGKFGDVLAKTKLTLERAAGNLEQAAVRSRAMQRKLKTVEEIPQEQANSVLGLHLADLDALEDSSEEEQEPEDV